MNRVLEAATMALVGVIALMAIIALMVFIVVSIGKPWGTIVLVSLMLFVLFFISAYNSIG